MKEKILYSQEKSVSYITFNNPNKLNSFDFDMIRKLDGILDKIKKCKSKAAVISGKGKAFSAGGDISWEKSIGSLPAKKAKWQIAFVQKTFSKIESMSQVFIAVMDGYAVGGGNELAMSCDIRIATENAKFLHPEVSLGTVAPLGATKRLPRLIGTGRAKYMFFTGDAIDSKTALEWGLVDFLVPKRKIKRFMKSLLEKITSKDTVPIALTKKSINSEYKKDLIDSFEAAAYVRCSKRNTNRQMLETFLNKKF